MGLGVRGSTLALAEKVTINNVTIRDYVKQTLGAQEVQERNSSEVYSK